MDLRVVQHLEQVPSDVGDRTWVLVDELQVFVGHVPHERLQAGEQRRVMQVPFWQYKTSNISITRTLFDLWHECVISLTS